MSCSWILGITLIAALGWEIQAQDPIPPLPPVVKRSYRATGEVVQPVPDGKPPKVIQIVFSEDYDDDEKMAAFSAREAGHNATFIENMKTMQTLQYLDDKTCHVVTGEEWRDVEILPAFTGYKTVDGNIRFSLQQLFNISYSMVKSYNASDMYRGIPARSWAYEKVYEENGVNVTASLYAYWTVKGWKTTSSEEEIPLGYEITKLVHDGKFVRTTEQYISVTAFLHNAVNKRVFEPKAGIHCPNRTGLYKFPQIPKLKAFSLHSEFIDPKEQDVRSFDIWYDMKNYLLRIDMDRSDNQDPTYLGKGRKMTSEITSKALGSTFMSTIAQGRLTCTVIKIADYPFEVQHIINPKLDSKNWTADSFIGINTTDYVHIGKTKKRNIPCHLFQGVRTDWPEPSMNITSLWEWCLAVPLVETDENVTFRDGELPLINAQVVITESNNEYFSKGSRMIHHFYDVISEDPNTLNTNIFDLYRCLHDVKERNLQFAVDVKIDKNNLDAIENATFDPGFIYLWKQKIADASAIPINTLRITQVKSTVFENTLYVMLTLLNIHPDLPDSIKSTLTKLEDAFTKLQTAIDGGKFSLKYGQLPEMKAKPQSLKEQMDPATLVTPTVSPTTTPSTTRTVPIFTGTLWTPSSPKGSKGTPKTSADPTDNTKSSHDHTDSTGTPSPKPTLEDPQPEAAGAKPGTVAAVTILMLILGVALGSAGTFYKFRGLPFFLRK